MLVDRSVTEILPLASVTPAVTENVFCVPLLANVAGALAMGLPYASASVNSTVVSLTPSASTRAGSAVSCERLELGAPVVKVTGAINDKPALCAVTVFVSALVECSVVVNIPFASVAPCTVPKMLLLPVLLITTDWFCSM
jgi:hypothetical protein